MFSEVLKRGIERKEFKANIIPDVVARQMMIALRGITYEWCIRYPDFDYKKQAFNQFELLLKGISDCNSK